MKKSKFGIVRIILIALLAVVAILAIAGFAACSGEDSSSSKNVPVYEGMEISSASDASATSGGLQTYATIDNVAGNFVDGNELTDLTNPFGDGSAIEEEVESAFGIVAEQSSYYAYAGEDIYITVKFINPAKYEILSFVINGERYASYMFESGSNMENIIVKINVGYDVGINEFEISEIKYVDGTEIKDVILDGDTVIKCGVKTDDAVVQFEVAGDAVTLDAISFTATITDEYSLIEGCGGYAVAVLYDGSEIVDAVDLVVGKNEVVFEGLTPDTLYQYAVVAVYDDLSGTGFGASYPYVNAAYTEAVVLFDNIEIGTDSISYDFVWHEGFDDSSVTRVILSRDSDGEFVLTEFSAVKEITGLWSNTAYTLNITYLGINGTTEHIWLSFTTLAKAVPTVEITVVEKSDEALTFEIDYIDSESVGNVTSVAFYCEGTLVQSMNSLTNQITFGNLTSHTKYSLVVSYEYDLGDGVGTVYETSEVTVYTEPAVEFVSMTVINQKNEPVDFDETIELQVVITNSDGVEFTSAVINGIAYDVSADSNSETLVIEIVNEGQFGEEETILELTQLAGHIDDDEYRMDISENNTVQVSVVPELLDENLYSYSVDVNGVYTLDKYLGSEKSVTLPSSIRGHEYVIGDEAFKNNTYIEEVVIPEGVIAIGDYAFENCTSLTCVTIPNSVKSIGNAAFSGCQALTGVYIFSLEAWCDIDFADGGGTSPLYNAGNLYVNDVLVEELVFPEGITVIKNSAFAGLSVKSLTIPEGVTFIGDYAFENCASLETVTIPDTVTYIGFRAFGFCMALKSVTIPSGVEDLSNNVFEMCTSLTSATICDGVKSIGVDCFFGCWALSSITIPDSVTSIGRRAFAYCYSLTSVVIPDGVTVISNEMFYMCTSLTTVTIGKGVETIGMLAFEFDTLINIVYYAGTAEEWEKIVIEDDNSNLTSATIYYYSETEPDYADGYNYWRYVDGEIVVWTKEN